MMKTSIWIILMLLFLMGCRDHAEKKVLFNPRDYDGVASRTGDKISFDRDGVSVDLSSRNPTSVITFRPESGFWDASGYRFVRCEIENRGNEPQLAELGFADYDLTQGAVIVPPGKKRILKAVIYRTERPAYIDSLFPVMHGKPDGVLRSWMASGCDSVAFIKLLFPEKKKDASVRIGKIWLEEPYTLYSQEELQAKFFPFVDSFGQNINAEWPGKIRSVNELVKYDAEETRKLESMPPLKDRNKYGGWTSGPALEATGRFRVEKVDGKWWFVDPEGKLFWSHGIDCVEFGTQTRTQITGREQFFQFLPPEKDLFIKTSGKEDSISFLSFHSLNIYRKYGPEWLEKSRERIHRRFRYWGVNTIGNWSDPGIYLKRETPYVLTAYSPKTGIIADPYAPGFMEGIEKSLRSKTEETGDPWCLGVFIDNELKWGVKWGPKIPEQILTAPAGQPAKIAFIEMMKAKYENIDRLNDDWGSKFSGWHDLAANEELIPGAGDDMLEFMKDFTERYYSACRNAVKEVDKDMLYLGCRMDFHLYPEDTSLNYVIRIASEYCDVVSFNRYRYTCSGLVPPDGGDFPIIIGEFHFGSLETGLLQPGLRYAANQDERAEFYAHYVQSALDNPFIVGTHWFQLVDQAVSGRPDGENYQAGFLTVGDVPQYELIEKSREIGLNMYRQRWIGGSN